MKSRFVMLALIALAGFMGRAAYGFDGGCACGHDDGCCCEPSCCADALCDACCDDCCGDPGYFAEAELLFLKYHRADGVRTGTDEPGDDSEFDYEEAFRFTVGVIGPDGLGIRVRYFDYDHTALDRDNGFIDVDTFTIDVEVFESCDMCCNWSLELAAGIRYNDFQEILLDDEGPDTRINQFAGWGGIVGAEVRRALGERRALYARVRYAILTDDKSVLNAEPAGNPVILVDTIGSIAEISMGVEGTRCLSNGALGYARIGFEWQIWENYSSSFEDTEDNDDFSGPSDVGFIGLTTTIGVRY